MPEHEGHTETLRAGTPFTVGTVTLLPIERVVLQEHKGSTGVWCWASKEPHALIVRDPGGIHVLQTDTAAGSLEQLRAKIPGLDTLLASLSKPSSPKPGG